MSDAASIEAALVRVVETVRRDYDTALRRCGLCMEPPLVNVCGPEHGSYSSEIRIDIIHRNSGQLVDCLEFFALEEGKSQLTDEELRTWLVEQITALTKTMPDTEGPRPA